MKPQRILFAFLIAAIVFSVLVVLVLSASPPGSYPPVKQTLEASVAQTRIAAQNQPQPPPGPSPAPASVTTMPAPRQPAGAGNIVTDFVPPFPAMTHVITTMWYEDASGKRIFVYAGALRDNPGTNSPSSQGAVIVVVQTPEGGTLPGGGTYLAPGKTGPLRIIGASGERLALKSDSGATLYFDVSTRQFVPSP